jgi:hypothetical protein
MRYAALWIAPCSYVIWKKPNSTLSGANGLFPNRRFASRTFERDGHDSTTARELLETYRALQAEHIKNRDRIVKELEG